MLQYNLVFNNNGKGAKSVIVNSEIENLLGQISRQWQVDSQSQMTRN